MAQNGPQWPPKATLSTLGSCTGSLCMIKAFRGLKKGQKSTQNGSRTIFRVQFFLLYRPKMAQNGPQWPPKATLGTLQLYTGSLHRIWGHWDLFWVQNRGEISSKMAQICPLQEVASGVLEAWDVKRHDFFDFFPHVYTHTLSLIHI